MQFEFGQKVIDILRGKKPKVYTISASRRRAKKLIQNKNIDKKQNFSIIITTYDKRFEKYLIPLIKKIREDFKGEIILTINGNYDETFNEEYRKNLCQFLSTVDNVYPIFFTEFRSLGKMWNCGIINSSKDNVLVLNDDLIITDKCFWDDLENAIIQSNEHSFKINGSWSHIYFTKQEVDDIGYFDERFLSIGWEDNDFESRYYLKYNKFLNCINGIRGIDNVSDEEDCCVNQKSTGEDKYSLFNRRFYENKYESTLTKRVIQIIPDEQQYPYEKFYREHKAEL
ncbi:hypothetical protein IJ732_02695 [bacterium]|nr:hypothetical protein [bacterium]